MVSLAVWKPLSPSSGFDHKPEHLRVSIVVEIRGLREAIMVVPWEWKKILLFGSLRERDCFLSWMRGQIASGISEEIEPPPDQPREPGDRWFRHIPTGSLWRLVPINDTYGPGFWPALDKQRVQRRLAAILAADVVGYSALMQRAEEATYAEFERLKRELIEPSLFDHEGRLIKTTGDGALVEFASPLAAVRCAVEIQDHLASGSGPFRLRVGLNLGDVIVGQDGELYGDGINIAVRLEGIADPGGILISEKVYDEVEGKLDAVFEDRGEQQLKNISKPVRAYAVRAREQATVMNSDVPEKAPDKPTSSGSLGHLRGRLRAVIPALASIAAVGAVAGGLVGYWNVWKTVRTDVLQQGQKTQREATARPDIAPRLSLVVLPFANLDNDPEQDYFADAVTTDLTTDLARMSGAFVIGRETAFTYKNK